MPEAGLRRHRPSGMLAIAVLLALEGAAMGTEHAQAELLSVDRIWDGAPHCAFTALVRTRGRWHCAFREATTHVSGDGVIRVLASADGRSWESAASLRMDGRDLRDAQLAVLPDARILLTCTAAADGEGATRRPYRSMMALSRDGRAWTAFSDVGDDDWWLWSVAVRGDAWYGFGYPCVAGMPRALRGYGGRVVGDSVHGDLVVESAPGHDSDPSEAALRFLPDGRLLCVLRCERDGQPAPALLGIASPPCRDWRWRSLGVYVGGPALLRLDDGRLLVGGRSHHAGVRTSLWELDADQAALRLLCDLPSGGDTSYPGLVEHDGEIWMSYYSSHEGSAAIYLARLRLPPR